MTVVVLDHTGVLDELPQRHSGDRVRVRVGAARG